ncbi:hypothetical protein OH799_18505 [Nocardia sp. NBC_00881]|uniref:hypothetical protein n=1 Tax=Nocardia sp. NBC_00881 TaxID=2975995 RepID=UPI0038702A25|nr:hypothetical protein OH799_18505 [Nocardia sp. NBC_00881]
MPDQYAPLDETGRAPEPVTPDLSAAAETYESGAASNGYLQFRHRNVKRPLKGGQRFLLYWNPQGNSWFYPMGVESHLDFSPKDEVARADVLEFMFDPGSDKWDQNLTAGDIKGSILFCGRRRDEWRNPAQRLDNVSCG